MNVVEAAALGGLTGLHAATWGAYKDARFEGFRWGSYVRSVGVGIAVALAVTVFTPVEDAFSPVVLAGFFYTLERLGTEWWKTILREDDQSAYTIPMRLGYLGRPIDSRLVRYGIGLALLVGTPLAGWALAAAQHALPTPARWVTIVVAGVGGWFTAFGGAYKDAPVEGFDVRKFFRSPAVATAWAVPLSALTDSWVMLIFACGGFSVASIETYKTFLTAGKPPGKFAGKPVRFVTTVLQHGLSAVYAALWLSVALLALWGLLDEDRLRAASPIAWHGLVVVAALAGSVPLLVLAGHRRTVAASTVPSRTALGHADLPEVPGGGSGRRRSGEPGTVG